MEGYPVRPRWLCPDKFHAELTGKTERSFLLRRHVYKCSWEIGFALQASDGSLWRPHLETYYSDGASIPHPIDWLVPALDSLRYRHAAMGIHDPAWRHGKLDTWNEDACNWNTVCVPRSLADSLLAQGIDASGGWRVTQGIYWAGVRLGSLFA
jgi:hypothetical protein